MGQNGSPKTRLTISLPPSQTSASDEHGVPEGWLHKTKKTIIQKIRRMINDFINYAKDADL